jgi:hypothetical protein
MTTSQLYPSGASLAKRNLPLPVGRLVPTKSAGLCPDYHPNVHETQNYWHKP